MAIKVKATVKYVHVMLFNMLYEVVLTFQSVNEVVRCGDHSNENTEQTFRWCCLV